MSALDFTQVPTDRLARETIDRARQACEVTDESWDAVGPLWLAGIPLCLVAATGFMKGIAPEIGLPWSVILLALIVSLGVVVPFWRRWRAALAKSRIFTEEMTSRRKELERRRTSPDG